MTIDQASVKEGDIIQLSIDVRDFFRNRLMIVDTVAGWGCQCYSPGEEGDAYYRAEWKDIVKHWKPYGEPV